MSLAVPTDSRSASAEARYRRRDQEARTDEKRTAARYEAEHAHSVRRNVENARPPRDLEALIAWFRELVAEELPVTLHKAGVWRDYGPDAEGGSVLGTPATSEPFRRFIENSASETDGDGVYVRPLRAALSRMSRRYPFTARSLFRLALVDGDWRRHAANEVEPLELMELYLERALFKLWEDFTRDVQRLQWRYD